MPLTELRIAGLRTLERLRLRLEGLTVLIGDNGTGKSSLLEACDLLRRATSRHFLDEFHGVHGGMHSLLRQGAPRLSLGVTIKPVPGEYPEHQSDRWLDYAQVDYDLSLLPQGDSARLEERIRVRPAAEPARPKGAKQRQPRKGTRHLTASDSARVVLLRKDGNEPLVANVPPRTGEASESVAVARLVATYLSNIHVHLPFKVMPQRLERLGLNLASAYHVLKNSHGPEEWNRTLTYVRLGLGSHVEDVSVQADPGGGDISLGLKFLSLERVIPARQLSDGMLSYLAFVALFRLRSPQPSLLVLDEPDLHLHPKVLMRVVQMLESMAEELPVLISTHSDRLLDGLSAPARSVVLCDLDEKQATYLLRPDPKALARWMEDHRGIGDIRGEGHEASVFTREEPL